jgi:CRP/FNR family transcriptional regulator, cyclic AMP receptor protein
MHGSTLSKRQVLRRSILFGRLGDEEIDAILAHAQVAKYAAGAQIIVKGDLDNNMMAVLNGRVSINAPSPDGRQVVLSMLHDGDVFGEIALLDGKERTADVNALTDCEILIVSRRSFWPLLERRPDICIDLMLVLCERLRHTNQQVEDLAFLDLELRIAKALLRLAEESGAGEVQAKPVAFRISQRELGELVGGSRGRVNKHLHVLKQSGIVTIEKGAIVILDLATLAERA